MRLPEKCASGEVVADLNGWLEYWLRQLGGLPPLPKMLIEGYLSALNVPEVRPELFDPTFERNPKWRCPKIPELVNKLIRQRAAEHALRPIERYNLTLPDGRRVNYHDYLENRRGRLDRPSRVSTDQLEAAE